MKERILKLQQEGLSYKQIVAKLGCSLGTVAYHCNPANKKKARDAQRRKQKLYADRVRRVKERYGCQNCGENDEACLDLHHRDDKDERLGRMARHRSPAIVVAEINKCTVLCANCHRKVHAGRLKVDRRKRCRVKLEQFIA
jgi:hypothetical protein